MALQHVSVGTKVEITQANVDTMQSSYRSCVNPQYPRFAGKMVAGMTGEVVHTFEPTYDATVKLSDGTAYHMKGGWFTPVV